MLYLLPVKEKYKKIKKYNTVEELKSDYIKKLDEEKLNFSRVISKTKSNIKTTPLYFDIDKFKGNILDTFNIIDDFLIKCYGKDNVIRLALKSKKYNKYHLYYPHIIVNQTLLKKIVNVLNKLLKEHQVDVENEVLDKSCITNFIRMEGHRKCKDGVYEVGSEYEIVYDENNYGMEWRDVYELIYNFKDKVTELKTSIEENIVCETKQDLKEQPKEEPKEEQEKEQENDEKYSQAIKILKEMYGNHKFSIESTNKGYKINCDYFCFVNEEPHNDKNQSCIFLNKNWMWVNCFSHGNKKIRINSKWKKIKKLLGSTKTYSEENNEMNDYQILVDYLVKFAFEKKLKRKNGYVYIQNPDIPLIFTKYKNYRDWLNEDVFYNEDDKYYFNLFRKSPDTLQKMLKFMEGYSHPRFDFLRINKHLFAFNNGYLDISNPRKVVFNSYEETLKETTTIHFDRNFDVNLLNSNIKDIKTPNFDKLCLYQLEEEIYEVFLGMAGRLHYKIKEFDYFDCCMFIKGGSNTGKSTVSNILISNHQSIGTFGKEITFGLESFIENNNELIYVADLPKDFHKTIDKGDLQRLITGEKINISRKCKTAVNDHNWNTPLLFVGNYYPDYHDPSGAIARRLNMFHFDKHVKNKDSGLEDRCIKEEGHLILLKTILSYKLLLRKFNRTPFEEWGIEYFEQKREEIRLDNNPLYNFLNLAPNDYEYWCVYEEGSIITLNGRNGFKTKYEKFLKDEKCKIRKYKNDPTTFSRLGYELIKKKVCGVCNQAINKGKCGCEKFDRRNRRNRMVIKNLRIVDKNEECHLT